MASQWEYQLSSTPMAFLLNFVLAASHFNSTFTTLQTIAEYWLDNAECWNADMQQFKSCFVFIFFVTMKWNKHVNSRSFAWMHSNQIDARFYWSVKRQVNHCLCPYIQEGVGNKYCACSYKVKGNKSSCFLNLPIQWGAIKRYSTYFLPSLFLLHKRMLNLLCNIN